MNIIDEMAKDAVVDKYFLRLFQTLEKMYWDKLLSDEQISVNKLSPSEYVDILTFADILSLSSDAQHKNYALKIISCLKCFYENDPRYIYYSQGIMVRLGNFPGFALLNNSDNNELPFDISLEKSFKEIINKDPYSDKVFTDAQYQLLEELFDKNHFSFSGPTSFGKSFILTSYIKYLMMNNKRGLNIAFVVPTRALVSQTLKKFKSIFDGIDGYYLSSSPDIPALFCSSNAHYIFVFTPERLLHYFSAANNPSIEYVFVDEAQKILSEDTRAVVYYHAISLAERKSCKLFFSSPNISNVDVFLKLFNKTSDETETISESPVCQSRLFIDMLEKKNIIFSDLNEELIYADYDFPDNLYALIRDISKRVDNKNPKSLIYCNTIEDTINCAKKMIEVLDLEKSDELNKAAKEIADFIHPDYYLVSLIRYGVGFHFGKLPQRVRDIIERLYEKGELHYLFCTSTLLEGVNLPAQNIFILNNQIGDKNFKSIDFWNLAGRAGRLTKELCGNVICVRWINKEGRWNKKENIDLIKNKKIGPISSDIVTGKSHFYKNVFRAAEGQKFTRENVSETQRRVYNAFSNVLISHFTDNQPSLLRNEFQRKEPESVKKIAEIGKNLSVPSEIICRFPLIKAEYQDKIWNLPPMYTPQLLEPTYENCLNMLSHLWKLYGWEKEESKGKKPLFPKGNKNFIKHYASLMSDWMNSKSINEIIKKTIFTSRGKTIIDGYLSSGQMNIVKFDPNNQRHINIIINNTISEIDKVIRFDLKNYFENYYCILEKRDGKGGGGEDWALFMEHGTLRKELIEIQKIGVPRHLSKLFYDDFHEYFIYNEDQELIEMKRQQIHEKLKKGKKEEYKELLEVLIDNYVLK